MVEDWKRAAAESVAKLVKGDMVIGLGSGTTMAHVVHVLAERRTKATFVPSSFAIQRLAASRGLRLSTLDDHPELDLTIDGADEIDPNFDMIKGRGGAHTREKILVSASKKVAIVVDRTKLVTRLGEGMPVPVEILPFAHKFVMQRLAKLKGEPMLRTASRGMPFVTDNGNYIVDVKFNSIPSPAELEDAINRVPGVVENGIFAGCVDLVYVGYEGGCKILRSKRDFLKFARSP
jgi:ribose 5-phosphate isomerase A